MVSLSQIEDQLKQVGCNFHFWGRPEIRELANILIPGEVIAQAVNGQYEGGFAMLVVTDHRLLLVDKKLLFLTVEDIRFDMIAQIDYSARLLNSTVRINTANRTLSFTAWNAARLRTLLNITQQRILDMRHHYLTQQFLPQRSAEQSASLVGGVALQTAGAAAGPIGFGGRMPLNPYSHIPLTMRRRRVPKFY